MNEEITTRKEVIISFESYNHHTTIVATNTTQQSCT